jgi:hypothetical protein
LLDQGLQVQRNVGIGLPQRAGYQVAVTMP